MNRYCNLDGSKKIREDYPNITAGFDKVQSEIDSTELEVAKLKNVTYTGSEHDALVTAALVDVEGKDYGPAGSQTYLDGRLDTWESRTKSMENDLNSGIVQAPIIGMGSNLVRHTGKVGVIPEIDFTGKTIINLLGKDGNCESIGSWGNYQTIIALDSANKVFGNNGFKITLTANTGTLYRQSSDARFDPTKYYLFSAYVKNGNAQNISIQKEVQGGGVYKVSSLITDATNFTRIGIILRPSDLNGGNIFSVMVNGSAGQYAYVDGIMLNEISAVDYAAGVDACLKNYPYADSYACLTNPYFENRRTPKNEVKYNPDTWAEWTKDSENPSAFVADSSGYQITADGTHYLDFTLHTSLKTSTKYGVLLNIVTNTCTAGVSICRANTFYGSTNTLVINSGISGNFKGSFITGTSIASNDFCGYVAKTETAGHVFKFKDIRMFELPTGSQIESDFNNLNADQLSEKYPFGVEDIQRFVVEGQFTNEDKVSIKDGKISGQLYWKHTTLFGKDYDWQFDYDFTGYKRLKNPDALKFGMIYGFPVGHKMVKYDGKLLSEGNTNLGADIFGADSAAGLYLTVPDSDSGWDESIPPNNDEVKVERNGWKAVATNGTRYALWRSKVDGSFPSGAYQTTTSTTGNGVTNITVPDGTQFTIGDFIAVMHAGQLLVGTSLRITNIVGNVLYLGTSINVSNGDLVVKGDNTGTGSTALLTWCKNNVAPGYAGDALHYKLANPEPITDVNTHIEGEIWSLQPGDNYLDIESGMILGEVATPVAYNNGYYYINHTFDVLKADLLRNQAELITKIYRNTVDDTSKWVIWSNLSSVENNVYGKSRAEISASNYYINATYTVDYQILKTLIAQGFGSLSMRYAQDVFTAVSEAVTALESKQRHDSALDTLVDLSMYERITRPYSWYLNTVNIGSTLFANVFIPIARKKVIPKVTIEKIEIWGCANGLANKITQFLTISELEVTKDYINITYQTSDATTISNAKTYGVFARNVVIAADCNGRV